MNKAVLIYDGTCPVCSGTVKWIRANEIGDSFEMLPCQSVHLGERFAQIRHSECMQAMHLVLPDGTIFVGEQALPEILKRLQRYRIASLLFKIPGAGMLSRVVYRWFARRRYEIASFLSHVTKNGRHGA